MALAAAFVAVVPLAVPPEQFGRFNLVLSVLQTGAALTLSWLNMALLRFGREAFTETGAMTEPLGTRLALHGALLLPTLVAAALGAGPLAAWLDMEAAWLRTALLLGLPLLSLFDLSSYAAQATGRFAGFAWGPVLLRLAQLAALAVVATGAAAAHWMVLMAGTLAGYGLGIAVAVASLPTGMTKGLRPSASMARRMLAYGRFQPVASGCAFLLSWMDLWFLRGLLGEQAVGIYAWAYTVTLMAMTLLVPLAAMLAPRAIDRHLADDTDSVRATLAAVGGGCALLAVAAPLGLALLLPLVAALPLGAYAAALAPMALLMTATTFQLGSAAVEPLVYAREDQAPVMAAVMGAAVLANALCDIALIPLVGLAGPALGTAAAYGTEMVLVWRLAARRGGGGVSPWPIMALGMASTAAAAAMAALPPPLAPVLGIVTAAGLLTAARRGGLLAGLAPLRRRLPGLPGRLVGWLMGETR